MKQTLTAIVIAKNEEARITDCLDHLMWADEIIVVDNGSTDKTAALSKQKKGIVITTHEHGFSVIRNTGLEKAKGTWVLYVDSDEIVGNELRDEIVQTIHDTQHQAFYIKRDTWYLGQHWPYKDKVERLFLRSHLKSWQGILHETPLYSGTIGTLSHPLIHKTHRTLEEMVAKTNEWSEFEAKLRFDSNHPPVVWWRLIRVMLTGFNRSFWSQGGWRAGTIGWIESIYQAFSMFITYAKLWEMQQKKGKNEN